MYGFMDLLAACGHSILDENQILYILGGIGIDMILLWCILPPKPSLSLSLKLVHNLCLMKDDSSLTISLVHLHLQQTLLPFFNNEKWTIKPFLASPFPNPREVVVEGDLIDD